MCGHSVCVTCIKRHSLLWMKIQVRSFKKLHTTIQERGSDGKFNAYQNLKRLSADGRFSLKGGKHLLTSSQPLIINKKYFIRILPQCQAFFTKTAYFEKSSIKCTRSPKIFHNYFCRSLSILHNERMYDIKTVSVYTLSACFLWWVFD